MCVCVCVCDGVWIEFAFEEYVVIYIMANFIFWNDDGER